jgi:1-acyl-sn-glycerol-3-phosphate acyltransferase
MPRAIVELSHAMPDITLIPFAVVGDKWRDEPWWTSGATVRLLLSEYVKYVAAEVRVRLADAGLELTPELAEQPTGFPRAAPAGHGSSQLIGFSMVSIFLRSLIYNVLFYLVLVFWVILGIPTFLMPRWAIMNIARYWARSSIWLMRVICNTRVEYRGLEKIPKGPLIVASKHQSMWETFALLQFFDQPLFILKRELTLDSAFGWYLIKSNMIGVDRRAGGRALLKMARRAGEEVRRGRQLIIFPEGTRTPVGAPPQPTRPASRRFMSSCGVICRAGGAQFGTVLAAPDVHALSRNAGGRIPRSVAARPVAPRIHRARLHRDRGRHQPAGRGARGEQAQLFGRVPIEASAKA